ncbi:MAG: DUF4340 domain-containing protein [Planctomycetota bacterium]|nr:DUF4340 domain-containing protein [Planctomycetota bacterium]
MSPKALAILVLVTLVTVAAAALAVRGRDPSRAAPEELGAVLPGLLERVNDVAEIQIEKGGESLVLRRAGETWVVPERGGYPARFERVSETLLKIARLEIVEPKTRKPERYARLGVEDPDAEDSRSTLLTLRDENGNELAALIVGNVIYGRGDQTVHVRRAGDEQAFLCQGDLSPETNPMRWIETEIVRIDNIRMRKVEIAHADGEVLSLRKAIPAQQDFTIDAVPMDRTPKTIASGNAAGRALAYLSFDDVRRASEFDFEAAETVASSEYTTFDGLRVTVDTHVLEEESWITLQAVYEDPNTPALVVGPQPEAGDPETAPPASDEAAAKADEVRAEVDEINARVGSWVYRVPSYKADLFVERMEDLLAELPVEEAPADGEPADEEPATEESADGEPADEESAGDEPAGDEPAGEKPAGSGDDGL